MTKSEMDTGVPSRKSKHKLKANAGVATIEYIDWKAVGLLNCSNQYGVTCVQWGELFEKTNSFFLF